MKRLVKSVYIILLLLPVISLSAVAKSEEPIKILAIGNSFSVDSIEQNLYELFEANGQDVIIGNMFIGGCRLETHHANMISGKPKYSYRKVVDGILINTPKVSLIDALQDEDWDYVSIQQASGFSGLYESYTPYLADLLQFILDNVRGDEPKLLFHQTWAYDSSSSHGHFKKYDNDQMTMYHAIVEAVQNAVNDNPRIYKVIPTGTAIQNARTSYLGDSFNRDGSHLEKTYGRYTAACTWYEIISGKSVVGNAYAPSTIDEKEKAVAQNAAHYAAKKPFKVTNMKKFKTPLNGNETFDSPLYVDFGGALTPPSPWFKVAPFILNGPVFIKDAEDTYCPVTIKSMKGFHDAYNGSKDFYGGEIVIEGNTYPKSVWEDALIVKENSVTAELILSGFDPSMTYDLSLLSLRYDTPKDVRVTELSVSGVSKSEMKVVDSGLEMIRDGIAYDSYQVKFSNVMPSAEGTITVSVKCKKGMGYLNAMIVTKNH